MVEEHTAQGIQLNQPAGHLEHGESLLHACVRETREETSYHVIPTALVGIYQWSPSNTEPLTYMRFAFAAKINVIDSPAAGRTIISSLSGTVDKDDALVATLDEGIICAMWLDYDQIVASRSHHRSPLVLRCVDDYLAGRRFPLDIICHED